jgi:chaperonin cofactor prefoldin
MEAQKQLPPEYQTRLDALQKANASLRELVNRQQQFEAQHTENAMVKAELDALKADEPVFKLHGKVLVRQDPQDAKTTVAQRIKMIEGELCGDAARRAPPRRVLFRGARMAFHRLRLTVPYPIPSPTHPLRRSQKLGKAIAEAQAAQAGAQQALREYAAANQVR